MTETIEDSDVRRRIPRVDRLLEHPAVRDLIGLYGRDLVRVQVRATLDELRRAVGSISDSRELQARIERLPEFVASGLETAAGGSLSRVLNATGIFLHTNLGRAPLPRDVARRLPGLLDAYCDLELDLESGRRGERNRRVGRLLALATGAQAGLVANNNAGALLLALATLAAGRQVVISRGELVEIGGSFRIPEILTAAGARLVEVGTTNRTHLRDYEAAIGEETALLLKVFTSNYRLTGFVTSVETSDLVELAGRHGLPVLVDEGSGLLRRRPEPQLAGHPSLSELVEMGCDLACGSGDKLLGGPQAGMLVGRADLVERCRSHPIYRALRPNRATYAALELVVRRQLAGEPLPLERLWNPGADYRTRLAAASERLGGEIIEVDGFVGGGAAPEEPIPGLAVAVPGGDALLKRLRNGDPPVVGYIRDQRVILDLRTVDPLDDEALLDAAADAQEWARASRGEGD